MNSTTHPFFNEILKYPDLAKDCKLELTTLPKPYIGKNIKAILLGADPTNEGSKIDKGLKELSYVFGLNSEYEKYFFNPQLTNLKELSLTKNDLYIQNLCRNYFAYQTSKNKVYRQVAQLWLKHLKVELVQLDKNIPVLATAQAILRILVPNKISAQDFYLTPEKYLPIYSESLQRNVYPFYRNPSYYLSGWQHYKNFLLTKLK